MDPAPGDLLAATAELVAIPSVSHDEAAIATTVEKALAPCSGLTVERVGDNVVARTELGRPQRLVLAGHLDTVPPNDNARPRLDGDTLWGLGASDMKGGLAVMLDLATTVHEPGVDVTWCFYAREEMGRADSGLLQLWNERPDLLAGRRRHFGRAHRARWSRPAVRARCGCASRSKGCGPTRRGRSPGAMPSIGSVR